MHLLHSGLFIEEMEPRRDWELPGKCGLANAILLGKGHICRRFCGSTARNSRRQSSCIKWSSALTDNSWTRWQIICHFLIWTEDKTWTASVFFAVGKTFGWERGCGIEWSDSHVRWTFPQVRTDASLIWKVWSHIEYCLRRRNRGKSLTGEVSHKDMSQWW